MIVNSAGSPDSTNSPDSPDDFRVIFSNITEPRSANWKDILIYGLSGVGKSPLMATSVKCSQTNKPIYFDLESGAYAAVKAGLNVLDIRSYAKQHKIHPYTATITLLSLLESRYEKTLKNPEEFPFPFNCLIFDSWTAFYDLTHRKVLSEDNKSRDKDHELGSLADRLRSLSRIKILVDKIRALPVHFLSTATTYSDKMGVQIPFLSTAASNYLTNSIDIIGYMKIIKDLRKGNERRVISFKMTSDTLCRDRTNSLPAFIDDISLSEIFSHFSK